MNMNDTQSRGLFFCFTGACLAFGALVAYQLMLIFTMPLTEFREFANISAIQAIREGCINIPAAVPNHIYLYGTLQPWLLSFIPSGWDTVLLCRLFTYSMLLLSAAVFVAAINALLAVAGKGALSPLLAVLSGMTFLLPHMCDIPSTLSNPCHLGLFLSMSVLLLSIRRTAAGPLLIPLLIVGCYMTKSYFLFSLVYVWCAYFFLYEGKKKWAELALLMLPVMIGIGLCFLSFQTQYALTHHLNMSDGKIFIRMVKRLLCCCALMGGMAWIVACSLFRKRKNLSFSRAQKMFTSLQKQVCPSLCGKRVSVSLFLLSINIAAFIVILRMGQHAGALGIVYDAQLFAPSVILLMAFCCAHTPRAAQDSRIAFLLVAATCAALYYGRVCSVGNNLMYDKTIVVQDFSDSALRVRGCALTAPVEWHISGQISDGGQHEYLETLYSPHDNQSVLKHIIEQYRKQLEADIRHQTYDVIYTDVASYLTPKRFPELKEYYTPAYEKHDYSKLTRWVRQSRGDRAVPNKPAEKSR